MSNKQITGSVSVSRNAALGGSLRVQGSGKVHHNLRVEGWLDAPNVKGVNKGVYETIEKLRETYPDGSLPDGSFAIVGGTLPGTLWIVEKGKWKDTGQTAGELTADVERYLDDVEALTYDVDTLKADLSAETAARKAADTALQDNIEGEAAAREEADTALQANIDSEASARAEADSALESGYKAADTALQSGIDAEVAAREAADSAIEAAYNAADAAEATARETADKALQASIDSLGKTGYRYMGVATPSTNPGEPVENVFYVAVKAGEYTHFGTGMQYIDNDGVGHEHKLSLEEGEVGLLLYAGHTSKDEASSRLSGWKKQPLDLSGAAVAAVKSGLSGVSDGYAPLGADQKLGEVWLPESVTGEPAAREEADSALKEAYAADDAAEAAARETADKALQANIDALGKTGYRYMGVATPSTNPGEPVENVFYLAYTAGVYENFGTGMFALEDGESVELKITLAEKQVALLLYEGYRMAGGFTKMGGWMLQTLPLALDADLKSETETREALQARVDGLEAECQLLSGLEAEREQAEAQRQEQELERQAVYGEMKAFVDDNGLETTWAELKAMRDEGKLVAGKWYRITDYECTTTQEGTSSAGHQFDVVVLATSSSTLSEEARAVKSAGKEAELYTLTFSNPYNFGFSLRYNYGDDWTTLVWNAYRSSDDISVFYGKDIPLPSEESGYKLSKEAVSENAVKP